MGVVGDGRLEAGRAGERAAAFWYARRGFRVVARNWRCGLGELDLVVARGDLLVFCEVKSRRGATDPLGGPYEAVTGRKRAKLRALAETFLDSGAGAGEPGRVRFDVASVTFRAGRPRVHVFQDAF